MGAAEHRFRVEVLLATGRCRSTMVTCRSIDWALIAALDAMVRGGFEPVRVVKAEEVRG